VERSRFENEEIYRPPWSGDIQPDKWLWFFPLVHFTLVENKKQFARALAYFSDAGSSARGGSLLCSLEQRKKLFTLNGSNRNPTRDMIIPATRKRKRETEVRAAN